MRKPAEFETHPVSFAEAMRKRMFRGVVKRVIDGDTITAMLDLGCFTYVFVDLRIADINTPEVVGIERAQGLEAKAFVETLTLGKPVLVQTQLSDAGSERQSFERYIADVWLVEVMPGTILVGQASVAQRIRSAGYDKLHPVQ